MLILLLVALWLACARFSYCVMRWAWSDSLDWTVGDRRVFTIGSLVIWPSVLIAGLMISQEGKDFGADRVLTPRRRG